MTPDIDVTCSVVLLKKMYCSVVGTTEMSSLINDLWLSTDTQTLILFGHLVTHEIDVS